MSISIKSSEIQSYVMKNKFSAANRDVEPKEKRGTAFDTLFSSQRENMGTNTAEESPKHVDNLGIIYHQMVISGEQDSTVVHNGVSVFCHATTNPDGSYKFHTTIGIENANTKWYSMMTKNGAVTFDLNDPGSVWKCLDMFTPEDANRILAVLQKQKIANGIEKKIDDFVNDITNQMQDDVEENTQSGQDTEDSVPSQSQIGLLFTDRDQTDSISAEEAESKEQF